MSYSSQQTYRANVTFRQGVLDRLTLFGPAVVLVAVSVILVLLGHDGASGAPLLPAAIFGGLAWFANRRLRARAQPAEELAFEVEARAGSLVVRRGARNMLVRGDEIASAHVAPLPAGAGARVILVGPKGRSVDVWLATIEEARALLDDLGVSPLERSMTFPFFFGLRVTVGVDGVLVAWPLLRRRRFIPHARIDDVRWSTDAVRLMLTNGDVYEIITGGSRPGSTEAHDALVERLLGARDAFAASEGTEPMTALARGGRSIAAWVRELRALSESAGSQYRTASLPTDTLWRVALDPAEKEELRIGASLALRAGLGDEDRQRLRVAASAAASPRVGIALAAAADTEDDDDLVRALEGARAKRS